MGAISTGIKDGDSSSTSGGSSIPGIIRAYQFQTMLAAGEELWVVGSSDRAFEVRMLLTKPTPTKEYLFDHDRYLEVRSELLSGSSGMKALDTNPNPRRP